MIKNHETLKNNQNKMLKCLEFNIKIDNKIYELIGFIYMPFFDHYTASICNNIKIKNSYISEYNYHI